MAITVSVGSLLGSPKSGRGVVAVESPTRVKNSFPPLARWLIRTSGKALVGTKSTVNNKDRASRPLGFGWDARRWTAR